MQEILHQLGRIRPCENNGINYHLNWSRILSWAGVDDRCNQDLLQNWMKSFDEAAGEFGGNFAAKLFRGVDAEICFVHEKIREWLLACHGGHAWNCDKYWGFFFGIQILTVQAVMIAQNPMWFFDCSNVVSKTPRNFWSDFNAEVFTPPEN